MILTNLETIMDLTNKETITKGTEMRIITQETIIENPENNPHGTIRAKEILENNPPGETKEVVTH